MEKLLSISLKVKFHSNGLLWVKIGAGFYLQCVRVFFKSSLGAHVVRQVIFQRRHLNDSSACLRSPVSLSKEEANKVTSAFVT